MATRGTKRSSGQAPAATAPLQGALREQGAENESSVLFKMVLDRLDAADRERRMELQTLQQTITDLRDDFEQNRQQLLADLAAEKTRNAEALQASMQQFMTLLEKKPLDPATRKAMIQEAKAQALREAEEHEARFLAALADMPTGTLISYEPETVHFGINGHFLAIEPGPNHDVPQCYLEAWERRVVEKRHALQLDNALSNPAGSIDRDANQYAAIMGSTPIWSQHTGRVK